MKAILYTNINQNFKTTKIKREIVEIVEEEDFISSKDKYTIKFSDGLILKYIDKKYLEFIEE